MTSKLTFSIIIIIILRICLFGVVFLCWFLVVHSGKKKVEIHFKCNIFSGILEIFMVMKTKNVCHHPNSFSQLNLNCLHWFQVWFCCTVMQTKACWLFWNAKEHQCGLYFREMVHNRLICLAEVKCVLGKKPSTSDENMAFSRCVVLQINVSVCASPHRLSRGHTVLLPVPAGRRQEVVTRMFPRPLRPECAGLSQGQRWTHQLITQLVNEVKTALNWATTVSLLLIWNVLVFFFPQRDQGYYYGYVYFRQVRDKSLKRGYFQKVRPWWLIPHMNLKSHVDWRGDAFKVTFGICYNMQVASGGATNNSSEAFYVSSTQELIPGPLVHVITYTMLATHTPQLHLFA